MEPLQYFVIWGVLLSPVYLTCGVMVYGVMRVLTIADQAISNKTFVESLSTSLSTVMSSPVAKNVLETMIELADRVLTRHL